LHWLFLYDKLVAQHFSLVSIGMVSFAAVAQFAPAIIGGIYWKMLLRKEPWQALLLVVIWFFTAVIPSMASSGMPSIEIILKKRLIWNLLAKSFIVIWFWKGFDSITHCFFFGACFYQCFIFCGSVAK
jgi:Na+/proline symporter